MSKMFEETLFSLCKKIHFILLLLIVLTLPFFTVLNSFLIILLTVNFLFSSWLKRDFFQYDRGSLLVAIVFAGFFLIYLILIIKFGITDYGYLLEKKFSLLIFPLLLGSSLFRITEVELNRILFMFLTAVLVAVSTTSLIHPDLFFGHNLSLDIDSYLVMRRPYFGLYILFSVYISFYFVIKRKEYWQKVALILVAFFLLYFSYLIYTKMAIISFFIALLIVGSIYFVIRLKYKYLFFMVTGAVLILTTAFFINKPFQIIVQKIIHFQSFDFHQYSWIYFLSMNLRYAIWTCCSDILCQDYNWLWGAGLDHQVLLEQCYSNDSLWIRFGVDKSYLGLGESMFNAHNQWFQIWLDCGLAGIIVITAIIVISIRVAVLRRKFIYLFFIIFFFSCCLTEAILEVQRGIVFYALFNSLFAFYIEEKSIKI